MAISVSYSELQGSPSEGESRGGEKTATRVLECDWGDRWTLMSELQNEDYENESGTGMTCVSATSAPIPAANLGSTTIAAYEKAKITASYRRVVFEPGGGGDEGINITESIEPTAEYLTIDGTELRWTNAAGDPVGDVDFPVKLFVGFDYIINKEGLDEVPSNILTLVGKVNQAAISPTSEGLDHLTFPAQTLLYQPPSISRSFNEDGDPVWNVSYRLTYKPNIDKAGVKQGWNYYFKTGKGAGEEGDFDQLHIFGGNRLILYETGDFTTI